MQRPTIPFSQQQMGGIRHFDSLREINEWLADLIKVHDRDGEHPYYLHIDHVQILPATEQGQSIPVLTIYHRVYLQRGL
jgi:hypothetical protein